MFAARETRYLDADSAGTVAVGMFASTTDPAGGKQQFGATLGVKGPDRSVTYLGPEVHLQSWEPVDGPAGNRQGERTQVMKLEDPKRRGEVGHDAPGRCTLT